MIDAAISATDDPNTRYIQARAEGFRRRTKASGTKRAGRIGGRQQAERPGDRISSMDASSSSGNIATELAKERNRAAADRTLNSWIRTSLALIGFGFGLSKILLIFVF